MRQLLDRRIAYYAPVISKRYRSGAGRVRTSYIPLFSNYVFVNGTEEDRYNAVSTGSIKSLAAGEGSDSFNHGSAADTQLDCHRGTDYTLRLVWRRGIEFEFAREPSLVSMVW
jgi:hypothetical protein